MCISSSCARRRDQHVKNNTWSISSVRQPILSPRQSGRGAALSSRSVLSDRPEPSADAASGERDVELRSSSFVTFTLPGVVPSADDRSKQPVAGRQVLSVVAPAALGSKVQMTVGPSSPSASAGVAFNPASIPRTHSIAIVRHCAALQSDQPLRVARVHQNPAQRLSRGRDHGFASRIAHRSLPKSQRLRRSHGISRVRSLESVRRFFQSPIAAELGAVPAPGRVSEMCRSGRPALALA